MESILTLAVAITLVALLVALWSQRNKSLRLYDLERIRLEQERELNAYRRRLGALSQATSDGLVLVNKNAQVVLMNNASRALLGVEDGLGKPLREIAWGYDLQPLVDQVLKGETESAEQIVTKGERAFSVRVESTGLTKEDGALVRLDEITELQRLGRVRRDFVANISHELRTPVTSLNLLVETITKETLNDKAFLRDLMSKIHLQIDLLRQLTDELMDLALIESGQAPIKLVETQVADLVIETADSLRPQADRKQISLSVSMDMETRVLADAPGIRKVIGNLIHNAIKFTNPGGRIEIRTAQNGDNVQFSVADTGIGISATDLSRVFERFYKADRARARESGELHGTGLGLAIAKHIIQAHGGNIWVESVERQGSTFFFTLPAAS